MKTYRKATPPGTKDLLFAECSARKEMTRRLDALFERLGYSEVVTPTLEYYDVFATEEAGFEPEKMFVFADRAGRLTVLRPDMTLPMARVAATRLKDAPLPLRLCYTAPVFRAGTELSGHSGEILQSGMELIGIGGLRADLEILAAAAETLKLCGADFKIEIGHNGFFDELLAGSDWSEDEAEDIRKAFARKNFVAAEQKLRERGGRGGEEALLRLLADPARAAGGPEAARRAEDFTSPRGAAILAYLCRLYDALCDLGYGGRVTLDLSLVHDNPYYTGVIFRGYVEGSGATVLSGGRYDRLSRAFGTALPATGFAVETDVLARVFAARNGALPPEPEIWVFGPEGYESRALRLRAELAAAGKRVRTALFETADEAAAAARRAGAARLVIAGEAVTEIDLREEAP